jgi:hypothetical protein
MEENRGGSRVEAAISHVSPQQQQQQQQHHGVGGA